MNGLSKDRDKADIRFNNLSGCKCAFQMYKKKEKTPFHTILEQFNTLLGIIYMWKNK